MGSEPLLTVEASAPRVRPLRTPNSFIASLLIVSDDFSQGRIGSRCQGAFEAEVELDSCGRRGGLTATEDRELLVRER